MRQQKKRCTVENTTVHLFFAKKYFFQIFRKNIFGSLLILFNSEKIRKNHFNSENNYFSALHNSCNALSSIVIRR